MVGKDYQVSQLHSWKKICGGRHAAKIKGGVDAWKAWPPFPSCPPAVGAECQQWSSLSAGRWAVLAATPERPIAADLLPSFLPGSGIEWLQLCNSKQVLNRSRKLTAEKKKKYVVMVSSLDENNVRKALNSKYIKHALSIRRVIFEDRNCIWYTTSFLQCIKKHVQNSHSRWILFASSSRPHPGAPPTPLHHCSSSGPGSGDHFALPSPVSGLSLFF